MDEQEKIERRAHIRLIITEALMFGGAFLGGLFDTHSDGVFF